MGVHSINSAISHVGATIKKLKTNGKLPFTDILSTQSINAKLNKIIFRNRVFSPDVTVFTFLSQVLCPDQSCQAAVAQVIAHKLSQGEAAPSANTSAYCQARARLPENVLSELAKESAKELETQAKLKWLWRNRPVKIPDGTTISMPDTAANQAIYPQPCSQKDGVGFPIARLVGVFSLGTGALLDLATAPCSGKGTGEHTLLRQLMHVFTTNDIVLGDAYYSSFFLIASLINIGADAVFPMHARRKNDFRKGKRLGKKDHLVQWKKPSKPEWMDEQTYSMFPAFITVREAIVINTRCGERSKPLLLVTTLLNNKNVTAQDLGALYGHRWFVELNLRSVKEVMCMSILRGKTPKMIHKEIWAHILAYNLIRKIIAQAAALYNKIPNQISFKLALQMLSAFRQLGIFSEYNKKTYGRFLEIITYKTIDNRFGRHEPRMVKRRPKAFPRLHYPRNFYRQEVA